METARYPLKSCCHRSSLQSIYLSSIFLNNVSASHGPAFPFLAPLPTNFAPTPLSLKSVSALQLLSWPLFSSPALLPVPVCRLVPLAKRSSTITSPSSEAPISSLMAIISFRRRYCRLTYTTITTSAAIVISRTIASSAIATRYEVGQPFASADVKDEVVEEECEESGMSMRGLLNW